MANHHLQKHSPSKITETKLSTVPIGEILNAVVVSQISRPHNFESLTAKEWKWVCSEIQKDYPDMTYGELAEIIINGVKGKYNKQQFAINAFTIFRWIEKALEIKKNAPKKYLPCPENVDRFWWAQQTYNQQVEYMEKKKLNEN